MMDFNLILLLVGLGLLLLVSVFVLLGCFAGLKKELKCAAIGFVVLLLALLVFGESSTILNLKGTLLKNFIQGIPSSAETIWDCILALVQSNVPGGAEIFVEDDYFMHGNQLSFKREGADKPYIHSINVVADSSGDVQAATKLLEAGYTDIIKKDLNEDAGGDYIYLLQTRDREDSGLVASMIGEGSVLIIITFAAVSGSRMW